MATTLAIPNETEMTRANGSRVRLRSEGTMAKVRRRDMAGYVNAGRARDDVITFDEPEGSVLQRRNGFKAEAWVRYMFHLARVFFG